MAIRAAHRNPIRNVARSIVLSLGKIKRFIINLLIATSTRNSPTTGITDGLLVTYPANTPSFYEGDLQNYGAWTNYLLQSNNLDLSWTQRGTFSAVQDLVGADGVANTGWTLSNIGVSGVDDVYQIVSGMPISSRVEPILFLQQIDAVGVIRIFNASAGTSGGVWDIDLSLLSASFERVDRNHPSVNIVTEFTTGVSGFSGILMYDFSGTGPLSVGFSGAQLNAGEISYPYGETTTTALSFLADVTTVPTPAFVKQDGDWALNFRGTPHETMQALKALFCFDVDGINYTEIQLNGSNIMARSVIAGASNGLALGPYSHTSGVPFETNVYYVAATKTLGIRSDDVSGDISAVAFVEGVLTSHPVITAVLSTGNRDSANQALCDLDNDGVPVFFASKGDAGW